MANVADRILKLCTNCDVNQLPKTVKIEITTKCNHQCQYCFNRKMKTHIDMDERIFLKTLEQLKKIQPSEIGLFHIGESTLHQNCIKWHKLVRDSLPNAKLFLTTNGTNYDILKELVDIGVDSIKFSINGYNRKSHYSLVGVDDFNQVLINAKRLIDYRNRIGSRTQLSASSLLNQNVEEQCIFTHQLEQLFDCFYMTEVYTQAGNIYDIKQTKSDKVLQTHSFPCYALFNMLYVLVDGSVTICKWGNPEECYLGNVCSDSIQDMWQSEKAKEARRKHLSHQLLVCEQCMSKHGSLI